jgi:excisionase family DNA binding protein
MTNPFDEITARLDALAVDVRALKARTNEKPDRKRRVGLSEAAQYCGYANRTMYKKTHRREVPHSKVGGRLFFDLDQLDAWIDAARRRTVAEVAVERMEGNK